MLDLYRLDDYDPLRYRLFGIKQTFASALSSSSCSWFHPPPLAPSQSIPRSQSSSAIPPYLIGMPPRAVMEFFEVVSPSASILKSFKHLRAFYASGDKNQFAYMYEVYTLALCLNNFSVASLLIRRSIFFQRSPASTKQSVPPFVDPFSRFRRRCYYCLCEL